MQRFDTRNYSIRDFEEWYENGELVLAPKFQRRSIWNAKARSYLIDTIIRGKPVPKIFMRQDINPSTRRTTREIVDGQQRLRSILDFLNDGFPILKTHNPEYGGMYFSSLDDETKRNILRYELAVDLLQDMSDEEIYDIFARLNTYSIMLNPQEQRNGKWFGEFKTSVYILANEYQKFWEVNNIFSSQKILRMAEAEFVSELLIAISVGIRARSKGFIDNFYGKYDDEFPDREAKEERFKDVMDIIGGIISDASPTSKLRESRLIYPLFCAIYHMLYGLPEISLPSGFTITFGDFSKLRIALEHVDEIFEKVRLEYEEEAQERNEEEEDYSSEDGNFEDDDLFGEYVEEDDEDKLDPLTPAEREFYDDYNVRWVHAPKRRRRMEYLYNLMVKALHAE